MLARKLRPMGFDALIGQEHVVRALRHALDSGRLHHAYLFTGTRGVGKTTIARIVAKSLNCEQGVSASPCEQCSVCTEVKENRFVDLIEVDAASRTGVDDTRELLENAQYLPTRGRYKVYLIDEVHMLSTASFNALLKTLEEPPEHVKFLLATTDPKKVPVTVLSRCLQFQLKNLSREAIAGYLDQVLSEEGIEFEVAALDVIARSAAGSMRDALSLTDQAIAYGQGALRAAEVIDMLGVVGRDEVGTLLQALASGSAAELMQVSAELAQRSADFADVLRGLMEALHDLAVQSALGSNDSDFSEQELQLYYQIALIGFRDLSIAPDERSGFEMTLLRMLAFAPESSSKVPPRSGGGDTEDASANDGTKNPASSSANASAAAPVAESSVPAEPQARAAAAQVPVEPGPEAKPTLDTDTDTDTDTSPKSDATAPHAAAEAVLAGEWFKLVDQLPVGGVTRMIAEHSTLQRMQLPHVSLLLDQGHDTLLSPGQIGHLSRALQDVLGAEVQLEVQTGRSAQETPAARRERESRERQKMAEHAIAADDKVNQLLAEFGGRVDEIRPLS